MEDKVTFTRTSSQETVKASKMKIKIIIGVTQKRLGRTGGQRMEYQGISSLIHSSSG